MWSTQKPSLHFPTSPLQSFNFSSLPLKTLVLQSSCPTFHLRYFFSYCPQSSLIPVPSFSLFFLFPVLTLLIPEWECLSHLIILLQTTRLSPAGTCCSAPPLTSVLCTASAASRTLGRNGVKNRESDVLAMSSVTHLAKQSECKHLHHTNVKPCSLSQKQKSEKRWKISPYSSCTSEDPIVKLKAWRTGN